MRTKEEIEDMTEKYKEDRDKLSEIIKKVGYYNVTETTRKSYDNLNIAIALLSWVINE